MDTSLLRGDRGFIYKSLVVLAVLVLGLSFIFTKEQVQVASAASAPTFVQEAETAWDSSTTPKVTPTFSVQAGDVLVAYAGSADSTSTLAISGGSLTWTLRQSIKVSGYSEVKVWTATVDTSKSMAVTFTNSGTLIYFGGNVFTFRGSSGIGASSKTNVASGAPTLNLTTTQANSAVVVFNDDWKAADGTSHTWRANAGTFSEQTYFRNSAEYTVYAGFHPNVANAGVTAVGLTAPTAQKYSIIAVEVKGLTTVDTTAPAVSLTAPTEGSTAVGNVTVSANASDNIAVAGVQFKVDGGNLGIEDTSAPYTLSWASAAYSNGAHVVSATARDASGNTAVASANVTVANSPVISGISATNITQTTAQISWTTNIASDSQVNYGLDGTYGSTTVLNSVLVTSHSQSLSNLNPGTIYHYQVLSRDATGVLGVSADNTFTTVAPPDTTAPTVTITSPVEAATVSGNITISANASDNVSVIGVQFKLDGNNLGAEDATLPYSVNWTTNTATNTTHILSAVARDAAGNTAPATDVTVTVNNPPKLVILTPTNGATVNGSTLNITYTETGDLTGVDHVHFYIDGGPEKMDMDNDGVYQITNVSAGPHVLAGFLVYQNHSKIPGTDAVSVNFTIVLPDTNPPTVSMTAPADGATLANAVSVTADAADDIGVAGVQFKLDSNNLGSEDTTNPYSFSWDTSAAANGLHTLTAVARDAAGNTTTSSAITVTLNNISNPLGQWSSVINWPHVAVHAQLLNSGKVLTWEHGSDAILYDPNTGSMTNVPESFINLLCAGEIPMADGRLMSVGGWLNSGGLGAKNIGFFNPATQTWTQGPNMAFGRWYPSAIRLASGKILVVSGSNSTITDIVASPEVYDPATNSWSTKAAHSIQYYPFMANLPNGKVALVGASEQANNTQTYDPVTDTWTVVDASLVDGASFVVYAPGKILKAGSASDSGFSGPSTNTAYTIDFNQPTPTWTQVGSMSSPRSFVNLTLLPDGNVLATGGGTTKDGFNVNNAVKTAEVWNPTTGNWTTLASMVTPRLYHSEAMLLPDGRVFVSGSGSDAGVADQRTTEIYSPAYLFKGARPTITGNPSAIGYGQTFFVSTPNAANISSVRLIAPAAITHSTGMNQGTAELAFTAVAGGINVTAPGSPNSMVPGDYMMFLVNSSGVPAIAPFVKLSQVADTTLPSAPTNLNASGSLGSASLTWTAATDNIGVVSYNVHRSTTSGFTPSVGNKIASPVVTNYTDSAPAGTYYYKVTAQDAAGNVGPQSNEASATVLADTTPPTVSVTSPADASTVSNTVTVTSSASDNIGVAGVQFKLDGANLDVEDTSSPYSVSWVTTPAMNGSHVLTAVARDAAGNTTTSAVVTVTVNTSSATAILGNNVIQPTTDNGDSNSMDAVKFTMPAQSGTAQSISVYIPTPISAAPNNQFQLAIYTNSGTGPATLVASTASGTIVGNAWNTLPISAALQANTIYWLAYNTNGTSGSVNNWKLGPGISGQEVWKGQAFGAWPASYGTKTGSDSQTASIYVTYSTP